MKSIISSSSVPNPIAQIFLCPRLYWLARYPPQVISKNHIFVLWTLQLPGIRQKGRLRRAAGLVGADCVKRK